ncbi:Gfo/Idh/MocA family oxidoreductase [Rathayibacter tanaceti]|uniref:Gfo/Idh/MocA family oxidoreductase n=1 Tax=Rathayibacter tanaceti TaxID=1671680 RepID=A0AAE6RN48_9MICO|nr:Gfo/Idh/MocA family oxidoreductase [Rathayibacter tanaceti]
MAIAVVGGGRIGALRVAMLVEAGHRVVVVDTAPVRAMPVPVHRNVHDAFPDPDLWIVATPTAAHLPALASILRRDPCAAVLLEKPACTSPQLESFRELLDRHPLACIEVVSQYQDSAAVLALARAADPRADLVVSFVKDRTLDEARGRFRDPIAGVLGYEWPHLYAIARSLGVSADDLQTFDPDRSRVDFVDDGGYLLEARWETTCHDGRRLILHSGIAGGSSRLFQCGGGDPSNYRLVRSTTASGAEHSLWLTPSGAADASLAATRKCLLVTEPRAGGRRVTTIVDDPLRTSMSRAITRLTARQPRDVRRELDVIEHTEMLLRLRTWTAPRVVTHAAS